MATTSDTGSSGVPFIPQPHASPEWSTDAVPLKDFSAKRQVPGFAKVVKGNYMTLGSSKFSFSKQHHEVFVHSVKVSVKVLAHCLRRVDATSVSRRGSHNYYTTTRVYAVDQRLAIPISYQGWFELLSEDGKSARPIVSVHELSKVKPDKFLVRENVKAYLLNDDGKLTFDKTKIVIAGEQLLLNGELSLPAQENKKIKLLRCLDSKGDHIYLSFDQKGTFTPIAGEHDFTGVFSIRDVVRRFRLPLTVKLIQGVRPKVDPSRFTGLVRLDWVYTDETAFVCPIERNHVRLLPVPVDANLQLVAATNQLEMKSTDLYTTMMTKCTRMITNYNNTFHLIVQVPDAATKGKGRKSNANVFSLPLEPDLTLSRSDKSVKRENRLMDEIDDLYGYVRDGGEPPASAKFTYDSDEESYWEEPAYEPLDDFRARLKAIEAGQKVSYHAKYQPQDPNKLVFDLDPTRKGAESSVYGVMNGALDESPPKSADFTPNPPMPPPLPPRPLDLSTSPTTSPTGASARRQDSPTVAAPPSAHQPPIRRYSQPDGVTTVSRCGLVSSYQSAAALPQTSGVDFIRSPSKSKNKGHVHNGKRTRLLHSKSMGSHDSNSNSGGSGSGQRNHIARDFKDSDISSVTKGGSSGGSSGGPTSNIRKRMQTLYL